MKDTAKTVLMAVLLGLALLPALGASTFDTELHHRILNAEDAAGPWVNRGTLLLSYEGFPGTQAVSLAFEHEDYRVFHTYERNEHGVFVLTMPVPEGMTELRYRLIVDGLWTVDPRASVVRDDRGVPVSTVRIPSDSSSPRPGMRLLPDGTVRFVYRGVPGARVSLVGDFNRWDPYLTPMEESPVHPGYYETRLRLPDEARLYRFVVDGVEIPDPENPARSRNGWGEVASLIR